MPQFRLSDWILWIFSLTIFRFTSGILWNSGNLTLLAPRSEGG
jgi:hypothetical protein